MRCQAAPVFTGQPIAASTPSFHGWPRGTSGQPPASPTTDGLTAAHTSMNGWPTISTCGDATALAIRVSLEPVTRWSTSTPSRRAGPGENSATIAGRSSMPPRYSTTTPTSRRSSPQIFSTSSASCRPST